MDWKTKHLVASHKRNTCSPDPFDIFTHISNNGALQVAHDLSLNLVNY